jgi:hypothetical protein
MGDVRDEVVELLAGKASEVTRIGCGVFCDVDHDVVVRVSTPARKHTGDSKF